MKMLLVFSWLLLGGAYAQADSLEDAAKRLGEHYYKGSEMERRINWLVGKIPVQVQLSLTYIGYASTISSGGIITWTKTFP